MITRAVQVAPRRAAEIPRHARSLTEEPRPPR